MVCRMDHKSIGIQLQHKGQVQQHLDYLEHLHQLNNFVSIYREDSISNNWSLHSQVLTAQKLVLDVTRVTAGELGVNGIGQLAQ